MAPRRQMILALGLTLAGAAATLLAATRPWIRAAWVRPDFPSVRVVLEGGEVAPVVRAAGLVALGGVVGILATRGIVRRVVGACIACVGVGGVVACLALWWTRDAVADARLIEAGGDPSLTVAESTVSTSGWPVVAGIGCALLAAAGVMTVLWGREWPAMGVRYDSPSSASSVPARVGRTSGRDDDAWTALDRGDDPTLEAGEEPNVESRDPGAETGGLGVGPDDAGRKNDADHTR
ncbi:MAG TPA: Trp biosynthesis-associated membrane protein [Actinopolymorphaceae bacterium]